MNSEKVKTLIVENNKLVCFAIGEILKKTGYHDIIDIVHTASDVVDVIKKRDIKLVLININLIYSDNEQLVSDIYDENPEVKIIGLSSENSKSNLMNMLDINIDGIIDNTHNIESLTMVSKLVMSGFQCIPNNKRYCKKINKTSVLTNREREILQLIIQGISNKDIAEKLNISSKTVSVHRYNIMFKLGIKSSLDLYKFSHYTTTV